MDAAGWPLRPDSRGGGASALKGDRHEEANVGRLNCWLTEIRGENDAGCF
jgi:hypothetical protein